MAGPPPLPRLNGTAIKKCMYVYNEKVCIVQHITTPVLNSAPELLVEIPSDSDSSRIPSYAGQSELFCYY